MHSQVWWLQAGLACAHPKGPLHQLDDSEWVGERWGVLGPTCPFLGPAQAPAWFLAGEAAVWAACLVFFYCFFLRFVGFFFFFFFCHFTFF
jgi:hypothetical protein